MRMLFKTIVLSLVMVALSVLILLASIKLLENILGFVGYLLLLGNF